MQLGQKQSQQQHPKYFMKTSRKSPCIKETKSKKQNGRKSRECLQIEEEVGLRPKMEDQRACSQLL
jgi:hypothetical protein